MHGMRILLWCALATAGCGSAPDVPLWGQIEQPLTLASGHTATWSQLKGPKGTVLVTLDPECPLSRTYAPLLHALSLDLAPDMRIVGIYPSPFVAASAVVRFAQEHRLHFAQVLDAECTLSRALHAEVMPEVFLIDAQGAVLYHGAIDDRPVRAGRMKPHATRSYLREALQAYRMQGSSGMEHVKAVGCVLECD
jgi:thiol-disulfide isomerase/thioredoxin